MMITPEHDLYPQLLRTMPYEDQPKRLFLEGNTSLLNTHCIAFTGCEKATELGCITAANMATYFAEQGYTIVAGLCEGIDQAAHLGAIRAKGNTIAVLPHALDRKWFHARPNKESAIAWGDLVAQNNGLLISEYETGTASGERYLARNRITIGLSLICIPVQAEGDRSGTMATVRKAMKYHRPVWTPTPIEKEAGMPQYAGIKDLIDGKIRNCYTTVIRSKQTYPEVEHCLQQVIAASRSWPVQTSVPGEHAFITYLRSQA